MSDNAMNWKVITNNRPRDILHWSALTAKEQGEFDYLMIDEDGHTRAFEASFFRYRGVVYDLGEFMRWTSPNSPEKAAGCWDGFQSDTYFSAIVVRYVDQYEHVIVGRVYS